MKYGFQKPEITESDFWLGSKKLGSQIINPTGNWIPYLPKLEHQRKGIETNCCVSFGSLSALEMLHKLLYKKEPNHADRFLCKVSGTVPSSGNNPKTVGQALRKSGCVDEDKWPYDESSVEEYYKDIPQDILDLGLGWLKDYEVGWEWVDKSNIKVALKRSPIGVAVFAWATNDKGEYIRLGASNHWCVLVGFDDFERPIIWDSYDEGLKTLEKGYELEYPMLYLLKKKSNPIVTEYYQMGFFGKIWLMIKKFLWITD